MFEGSRRTRVADSEAYFYPDGSVVCGASQDPIRVVEVLSESTEAFDHGAKFMRYKTIPALREYVLVSQSEMRVESFLRGDDRRWTITEFEGPEGICSLESAACDIPLKDLYANIQLEAAVLG